MTDLQILVYFRPKNCCLTSMVYRWKNILNFLCSVYFSRPMIDSALLQICSHCFTYHCKAQNISWEQWAVLCYDITEPKWPGYHFVLRDIALMVLCYVQIAHCDNKLVWWLLHPSHVLLHVTVIMCGLVLPPFSHFSSMIPWLKLHCCSHLWFPFQSFIFLYMSGLG